MTRKKLTFIIFSILFFCASSCRKDEGNSVETCPNGVDTLITSEELNISVSSPYLAAYPESWWYMSNDDSIYCSDLKNFTVGSLLEENKENCYVHYKEESGSAPLLYSNHPDHFLYGLGYISGGNLFRLFEDNSVAKAIPKINEQAIDGTGDPMWKVSSSTFTDHNGYYRTKTVRRTLVEYHTSYTTPNGDTFENVAEIETEKEDITHAGTLNYFSTDFYAEEIGLIHLIRPPNHTMGVPGPDSLNIYVVDYYIAPH